MRALIVDDEAPARSRLRRLLGDADVQVVGEAADAEAALRAVGALAPDVLFLDVQMPEASGFDVAASLPDGAAALVFVTAFDRYALQAFDAQAIDYLLKPVEPERLARTLQRLRAGVPARATARPPARLIVAERGRTEVVSCDEIDWLEAADNYVTVHAGARELLLRRTLAGLLADLGGRFVRIHRSAAVALDRVASVRARDKGDATVVLRNGAELPCSRAWRAALLQRLHD